ncbi:MAG: SpoIIE family protein phosphatase [Treponema sp.]|jgi:hypothetical protein|nr:SpoIIE family protein phosphatase [Treponema sp.]
MNKLFYGFFLIILFLFPSTTPLLAVDFFWEEAELFTSRQGRFPVSAYSDRIAAVAWQEVTPNRNPQIAATGFITIYLAVKVPSQDTETWQQRGAIAGPYAFSGTEPSILSITVDNRNRIIIAAATGGIETELIISEDYGATFQRRTIDMGAENSVAPRIYVRADGGYLLFATRGLSQSLSIYYSRSDDLINWAPFESFTPETTLSFNFLPAHASIKNRDIVFFQSLTMGIETASNFQLYFKISENGGRTWTEARRLTTFTDPVHPQANPNNFDNQRPHIIRYNADNLFLVWERRLLNQSPHIYSAVLDVNGNLAGQVERVNSIDAYCNYPIGFIYKDQPIVVWFDNRSGNNRIILAQRGAFSWDNHLLSSVTTESSFARPIISQDSVFIFWQTTVRDTGRIFVLAPDRSVDSPVISTLNFASGRVNRAERARVSWNIPRDTSGIYGFSYSWSQDENVIPPEQVMIFNIGNTSNLNLENYASTDGLWYFSVRALDYAGNWSVPSTVTFHRKTIPPPALTLQQPATDENGFLISNNLSMLWEASADPFIAGYTWNLQYLGTQTGTQDETRINAPPSSLMGTGTTANFQNIDNGTWVFAAAAIDQAGNIGQPANVIFRTNKFIPFTDISFVDARQDEQGVLSIRLIGRGFTTNGTITSIVLEQETSTYVTSDFTIHSDREISGIVFEQINEGNYRLRIEHSTRGWFTAAPFVAASRTGTVKFGDYSHLWRPTWNIQPFGTIVFNPIYILTFILIILCLLGFFAVIRGIGGIITENTAIRQEAYAIITGDFMPMEKKQKIKRIEKRGRGLSFKLTSFTIALVLVVIIMISTPMYLIMTNTQRETLLKSLHDRSTVLLEGLVSSVRSYMPLAIQTMGERGILEMMNLPSQSAALSEANYITIMGKGLGSIHTDHIWASNDPEIISKIDTTELRHGVSRFTDSLTGYLQDISGEINSRAQESAGDLSRSIREMTQEAQAIPFSEANIQRIMDIQVSINSLEVRLTETLSEVFERIGSYPQFYIDKIDNTEGRKYIFYKPILYHQAADNDFFRGFAILEVSLDSIVEEIFYGQMRLLLTIVIVALVALIFGIIGAVIFSNLIIIPLRKLVSHIELIRDTDDKAKLAGKEIQFTIKDEIAVLGNTINDMTQGLVKAALAASDLSIGKEIQKKFIPLDADSQGNKHTTGIKRTPNLEFFGYYEGAKGVSGDYFDYIDLGGRYYAIIKCDVAGKGIPAALIMIQVATMFMNHFKQWKPNEKGMKIEEVVYQINDFIEHLGFQGRFAAFTLCLFDSETGIVRFCNAGDNIINYYDVSENKLKTINLPATPATGVLPNVLIEATGGYKVQTVTIDKGDILLLFTDGIEEAKRKFRNSEFKEILCTEGPVDTPHGNHLCGQGDEELSGDRVKDIINAVMARQVYTLHKYHNPEGEIELQFDFSTCEGNADEVIMALVSVEKMFRCYKPANAGPDNYILVDKKVDEFLKNHFVQYRRYCAYTRECNEYPAYMYYTHVMEDEQYDDLTILGIKRI